LGSGADGSGFGTEGSGTVDGMIIPIPSVVVAEPVSVGLGGSGGAPVESGGIPVGIVITGKLLNATVGLFGTVGVGAAVLIVTVGWD
jgi:hypothetical protein